MRNTEFKKTTRQLYRVDRKAVCFIKFILEAYDGLAVVETLEPTAARIALHVAPGCETEVAALLADLRKDFLIEPTLIDN